MVEKSVVEGKRLMPIDRIGEKLDALFLVVQRFQRSENYCNSWHVKGRNWYKRYRSYKSKLDQPYKNNVFDRLTFTLVESHVAKMMQAIFQVKPFLSILPVAGREANPEIGKQLEKALDTLNSNPDRELFLEVMDWEKQNAIMGTSYLNVTPRFDFSVEKRVRSGTPYIFDGINFDTQEFEDTFPDPAAKRMSRCRYVIKRSLIYWDEMEELSKNGVYDKEAVKRLKSKDLHIEDKVKVRLQTIGYTAFEDYNDPKTSRVEILDYFEDGHIITVGGRIEVLRDTRKESKKKYGREIKEWKSLPDEQRQGMREPTLLPALPYHLPLIDLRFVPVPGEFFGISLPDILSDDQDYINSLKSQRLDNLEYVINKLFKLSVGSLLDMPGALLSQPGGVMLVENQQDLQEFPMSDVTGQAWEEEQAIKGSAYDAAGDNPPSRGIFPERKETATGIMEIKASGDIRFQIKVKMMEFHGIRQIGKKEIQIVREFMPQDQYERLIGETDAGLYQLSLEEIFDLYDLMPVGSSVTSHKELRVQQIQQAYGLLSQLPPQATMQNITPFAVDIYELAKMILESLDIKNIDEIMKQGPELQQFQQRQQQMAMQQQQQALSQQYTEALQEQQPQPQAVGF